MEYIVAENDTLSAIASKYNVSAERILRLNNLRSAEDLRTGMVLVIDNLPQQNKAWEDTLPQCDSCQKAEQLKAQGRANIPGADFDAGFNQPAENDGMPFAQEMLQGISAPIILRGRTDRLIMCLFITRCSLSSRSLTA